MSYDGTSYMCLILIHNPCENDHFVIWWHLHDHLDRETTILANEQLSRRIAQEGLCTWAPPMVHSFRHTLVTDWIVNFTQFILYNFNAPSIVIIFIKLLIKKSRKIIENHIKIVKNYYYLIGYYNFSHKIYKYIIWAYCF